MNRERRKTLRGIADQIEVLQLKLEELQAEEEEYRDSFPENLQSCERYECAEAACEALSEAIDNLEDAVSNIEDTIA